MDEAKADEVCADRLEEGHGDEDFVDDGELGVEARSPIVPRDPGAPSAADVEEHCVSHIPFRPWCIVCVMGRGRNPAHTSVPAEDRLVPSICCDYCFLKMSPNAESLTVLVCRDRDSKTLFCAVLPGKGGGHEWAVKQLLNFIKRMGHAKCIIKTDQETALVNLIEAVIKGREHATISEYSPVKESQSNGIAEKAVQSCEEMTRTIKIGLERRMNRKLPTEHPVMKWLVSHAGDTVTRFQVGTDGKTAYERLVGKKYKGEVVEFGAKVLHRLPGVTKPTLQVGKLAGRWETGVWLGNRWGSGEHIIGTAEGIVRSRAIKRLPKDQTWDQEAVAAVIGTPWRPDGVEGLPLEIIPLPPQDVDPVPETATSEPKLPKPRSARITCADLVKYGMTRRCGRCQAAMQNRIDTNGVPHTPACRQRIEEAMKNDPDNQEKSKGQKMRKPNI